jgi:hypothetical protein
VILGPYDNSIDDPKVKIIYQDANINIFEFKIMELLYEHSLKEDFNVVYLHTKGVSCRHQNENMQSKIGDWINLMLYYVVQNYKLCLQELKEYEVVGVNLTVSSQHYPWHFSGNMWWTSTEHIRKLGVISDRSYCGPEFYITSKAADSKYLSLWNSGIFHYHEGYHPSNYIGKIRLRKVINHCDIETMNISI